MNSTRILHVDDEADIREVVEASLGLDPEFAVQSCASGGEAIEVAADWQPDLVLLDVMMPVMDGPTAFTRLRADARTSGIPVVFMTARAQTREIELFHTLGAEGVIAKPFDPMTLAATVRNYLPSATNGAPPRNASIERELRRGFVRRAKMDAAVLIPYGSALEESPNYRDVLRRIKRVAHSLAGSAAAFGLHLLNREAASLEEAAATCMKDDGAIADVRKAVEALLAQIDATPVQ